MQQCKMRKDAEMKAQSDEAWQSKRTLIDYIFLRFLIIIIIIIALHIYRIFENLIKYNFKLILNKTLTINYVEKFRKIQN